MQIFPMKIPIFSVFDMILNSFWNNIDIFGPVLYLEALLLKKLLPLKH